MRTSRRYASWLRRVVAALLATAVLVLLDVARAAEHEPLVVIVNDSGPLLTASDAEVRDMFLGKIRVVGGVAVQPAQLDGPARAVFARALLRMSEAEFQLYWMRKAYEDGRLPPPVRSSAAEILRFVSTEPGAIAFVEKRALDDATGVRVLREIADGS